MAELRLELWPLGSFAMLFSVTPVREGLFFAFSVVSFVLLRQMDELLFSLDNGHGLYPQWLGIHAM